MIDTSALRAFIEARLDEDERMAFTAGAGAWSAGESDSGPTVKTDYGQWESDVQYAVWHCEDEADGCPEVARKCIAEGKHIARHDPARVLREVVAKRAILAEIDSELADDPTTIEGMPGERLQVLASVWSDHPDYRQQWGTA